MLLGKKRYFGMSANKYSRWLEQYGLEELRRLAEAGLCEEDIAIRCGLKLPTFRAWRKKHPEFSEAIMLGRREADLGVVKSLYKKAIGYNVALKKTYKLKRIDFDPDTGKKIREYEELATGIDESHVPADLRAETFWLKNRQGDRWCEGGERDYNEESEGGIVEMPEADLIDCPPLDSATDGVFNEK